MKKYIYILTDCNRKCLQVGFTDNLLKTVNFYKETCAMFFDSNSHASRLVYFEEFTSEELVIERFNQLLIYTRPQKERLIRALNTNWVDLSLNLNLKGELLVGDRNERGNHDQLSAVKSQRLAFRY